MFKTLIFNASASFARNDALFELLLLCPRLCIHRKNLLSVIVGQHLSIIRQVHMGCFHPNRRFSDTAVVVLLVKFVVYSAASGFK